MSDLELTKYVNGLNDCWKLFKQYALNGDPGSIEYWDGLVAAADQIYHKHDIEMIRKILVLMVEELEGQTKKRPS